MGRDEYPFSVLLQVASVGLAGQRAQLCSSKLSRGRDPQIHAMLTPLKVDFHSTQYFYPRV